MYQSTVPYLVRVTGLEPARLSHWNLNPTCLPIPPYPHLFSLLQYRPVGVPDIFLADGTAASAIDPGHSLWSLLPPPAALPSLPNVSANSTIPASIILSACGRFINRPYKTAGVILARRDLLVNGNHPTGFIISFPFPGFFLDIPGEDR